MGSPVGLRVPVRITTSRDKQPDPRVAIHEEVLTRNFRLRTRSTNQANKSNCDYRATNHVRSQF
jgi:hypothetical protein